MEIVIQTINSWGPPGVLAAFMWVMLNRSEQREAKKDLRIQLLENLLTESYDERISAADQISKVIHDNSTAFIALTNEIRAK